MRTPRHVTLRQKRENPLMQLKTREIQFLRKIKLRLNMTA